MDCVPQPTGLLCPMDGSTLRDLQKELKCYLYKNGKEIAYLPVTNTITNLDPKPGAWSTRRGSKLILFVTDGKSQISWDDYRDPNAILGVLEDVSMMPLRPSE